MAFFPDIGPTIAAAGLFRAFFKAKSFTCLIGIGGIGLTEQGAEVVEMRLRGLPFAKP